MLNLWTKVAARSTNLPATLPLAQIQQLKDGFGLALAVLLMFGFFWGIIKIWSGANAISKGDPDGKAGIVAGIIIAGAVSIMTALFAIFGLQDAVVTPRF